MSDWIDPKKKTISQQRAEGSLYQDDSAAGTSDVVQLKEEILQKKLPTTMPPQLNGSPGQGKTNYGGATSIDKALSTEPLIPLKFVRLAFGQTSADVEKGTFILSELPIFEDVSSSKLSGVSLKEKLSARMLNRATPISLKVQKPKGPKA